MVDPSSSPDELSEPKRARRHKDNQHGPTVVRMLLVLLATLLGTLAIGWLSWVGLSSFFGLEQTDISSTSQAGVATYSGTAGQDTSDASVPEVNSALLDNVAAPDSTQNQSVASDIAPATPKDDTADAGSTFEEQVEAESPDNTTGVGHTVVIDAGHQLHGDLSKEPIGPGSSKKKARVAGGTSGVVTHIPEYKLNLKVALKLEKELKKRGYSVVMVRTSNDVNISNAERSKIANKNNADLLFRIHANGDNDSSVRGFLTLIPAANEWTKPIVNDSKRAGKAIHSATVKATSSRDRGISSVGNMTGFNWSQVPSVIVEMGFMSNAQDDRMLNSDNYQDKLVLGFANGIDNYFK